MAKHLTDDDISHVVELLDEWPLDAKLTWDLLVEAFEDAHHVTTTRQTLSKQGRIATAFQEVKGIISGKVVLNKPKLPPSLKIAAERLEIQQRKIERLERENHGLLETTHIYLYNAYRFGVTDEQLSEPLPNKDNQ